MAPEGQQPAWLRAVERIPGPVLPLLSFAIGMALAFGPELSSGLKKIPRNARDAWLVNYSLEHGYQWWIRTPLHSDFWQLPIFHPAPNVTTFTDVLVGLGPLYWLFRGLGAEPDTSLQLWILLCWSLNFGVAFLLMRRGVGAGVVGSTLGALLVAFASRQLAQVHHPQLIPLFLMLIAALAVYEIFREAPGPATRWRTRAWIALLAGCFALQFWTAFYLFFFFGLLLALALLWSLAFADTRRRLFAVLRSDPLFPVAAVAIGAALIAPLGLRYFETVDTIGHRPLRLESVPQPASWLLTGKGSFVHGWLHRTEAFSDLKMGIHGEGYGFVSVAAAAAGLFLARRRPDARLLLLATGSMILASTLFGEFTLWSVVREWIPGAEAIRSVARITMIMLLAVPIGVVLLVQRSLRSGRVLLALLLAFACLAEQARDLPNRGSKQRRRAEIARLAAKVDPKCDSFFLADFRTEKPRKGQRHFAEDDAAWVQLAVGKPSVNGRYGNFPKGWRFFGDRLEFGDRPHAELRTQVDYWMRRHNAGRERVCIIDYSPLTPAQLRRLLRSKAPRPKGGLPRRAKEER